MSQSAAHNKLVGEILLDCGADPRWRIWRNNTGAGLSIDGKRHVRFGLEGSADIIGLKTIDGEYFFGVFVAMEVKTGKAVQSKEQKAFQQMIVKFGGEYAVVRSVAEARGFLESI